MTPDQRAKELREALDSLPPSFVDWRVRVAVEAARERLSQLEGQALVIEKVDGEWPEWFRLSLRCPNNWKCKQICACHKLSPDALAADLAEHHEVGSVVLREAQMHLVPLPDRTLEDETAEKLDNLKASVERANAKRSLPDRGAE